MLFVDIQATKHENACQSDFVGKGLPQSEDVRYW